MKRLLCSLCLVVATSALSAAHPSESITINSNQVYTISSFDEADYFSVIAYDGTWNWELSFKSKIISWKSADGLVFIFSKSRDDSAYFVTCVGADGKVVWEKPINAPVSDEPPVQIDRFDPSME